LSYFFGLHFPTVVLDKERVSEAYRKPPTKELQREKTRILSKLEQRVSRALAVEEALDRVQAAIESELVFDAVERGELLAAVEYKRGGHLKLVEQRLEKVPHEFLGYVRDKGPSALYRKVEWANNKEALFRDPLDEEETLAQVRTRLGL
jgi:hypothetical protein